MFRRGGVDDICALLVSVAHEQQEPPSSPPGPAGPQAARAALLPSLTAPGQMQDGSLQATGLDTEGAEQLTGQLSSMRHASCVHLHIHSFIESVVQSFVCFVVQLFVCCFMQSLNDALSYNGIQPCIGPYTRACIGSQWHQH